MTAPALDFGPATTTPAARHRWTTAPGGRAPRPVKATRGKQRTLASVQHGPRRAGRRAVTYVAPKMRRRAEASGPRCGTRAGCSSKRLLCRRRAAPLTRAPRWHNGLRYGCVGSPQLAPTEREAAAPCCVRMVRQAGLSKGAVVQYNAGQGALVVKHSRAALVTTVSASSAPQVLLWKRVHCSGSRSGHLSGPLASATPAFA